MVKALVDMGFDRHGNVNRQNFISKLNQHSTAIDFHPQRRAARRKIPQVAELPLRQRIYAPTISLRSSVG
jgi:hypothetical protein